MILDCRGFSSNGDYRPYSLSLATYELIRGVKVGASVRVENVISALGENVPMVIFRATISKVCSDKNMLVVTRADKETGCVVIFKR